MIALALLAGLSTADASSHREAPAISLDPAADLSDFYAFVSPNDPEMAVFILNVNPLSDPGGGPNFHRFDDEVRYAIHIDNEGDGLEDISFVVGFETTYNYPEEFLYNLGDISNPANLNQVQTYQVNRVDDGMAVTIATGDVAPANVGTQSDPYEGYTPETSTPGSITSDYIVQSGIYRTFAGPRQEMFYVDLERTFDLLNLAQPTPNLNTLLGKNVHTIAIEVPIVTLTKDGLAPDPLLENEVIAAWATTSRHRTTRRLQEETQNYGPQRQVSRLGSPLVNEVVLPVSQKDIFNSSHPIDDAQFLSYVTDPILPIYIEAILGVPDPGPHSEGLGIGGREDLVLAFLTGHPAVNTQPGSFSLGGPIPGEPGKVFEAFEALRLNLSEPVSSFPNGRYVTDDVTDVALSAMVGLLIDGTELPDGVDDAGLTALDSFPFLGDPWDGDDHPALFHDE